MFKNTTGQKVTLFVLDTALNIPKVGDAANLTFFVSIDDGAYTALTDTTVTEDDATSAKGYYTCDLTQAETNGNKLKFTGVSTTSNVYVVPDTVYTTPPNFSTTAISNAGGMTLADGVDHGGSTARIQFGTTTSTPAFKLTGSAILGETARIESTGIGGIGLNVITTNSSANALKITSTGDALTVSSSGGKGLALNTQGNGIDIITSAIGNGIRIVPGISGIAIATGSAGTGYGIQVAGSVYGLNIAGGAEDIFLVNSDAPTLRDAIWTGGTRILSAADNITSSGGTITTTLGVVEARLANGIAHGGTGTTLILQSSTPGTAPLVIESDANATPALDILSTLGDGIAINANGTGINVFGVTADMSGDLNGSVLSVVNTVTATLQSTGLDAILLESGITPSSALVNDSGTQLSQINMRQGVSLVMSSLAGVLSGAATTNVLIRPAALGTSPTRIDATVTADGDRTALSLRVPN